MTADRQTDAAPPREPFPNMDISICIRCAMSDGWPRRLVEAPPAIRNAVCWAARTEALSVGGKRPPEARCLAGRGHGRIRLNAKGQVRTKGPRDADNSYVAPWDGNFTEHRTPGTINPNCSDFLDVEALSQGGNK